MNNFINISDVDKTILREIINNAKLQKKIFNQKKILSIIENP